MFKIALEGMEFFAYHGYYGEEQILGNDFLVDVYLEADILDASLEDNIHETINYDNIYLITKFEMQKPSKLLEHLGERIANQLREQYADLEIEIEDINVRISKKNPPLGGIVGSASVETSGVIGLEKMQFYGYHGVTPEERTIGNTFIIDVKVCADFMMAAESDDLNDTLNYESIYMITKSEMSKSAQLLENVGHRIAANLKSRYNFIEDILVEIRKMNPPITGRVPEAMVQIYYSHLQECGKCESEILCYNDESCWCNDVTVYPATQELLQKRYDGCLCGNCLSLYAG